jgi:hypothetical protein
MIEREQCELLLKLTKDEIASQANTFDQIDNKTGVALGFTFVAVGQVLASVFRMATDQSHFQSRHPHLVAALFLIANGSVLLAIVFGIRSRWPKAFLHSLVWDEDDYSCDHPKLLNKTFNALKALTVENEKALTDKGKWAKWTYRFVALALLAYVGLTLALYFFSIPTNKI